jgi:hypothetical protein
VAWRRNQPSQPGLTALECQAQVAGVARHALLHAGHPHHRHGQHRKHQQQQQAGDQDGASVPRTSVRKVRGLHGHGLHLRFA